MVGLEGGSSQSYIYGGVAYDDAQVNTKNVRIRNTSNTVLGGDGSYIYGGVLYDDGYEHNLYRTSITNTKNVVPMKI